jgi:antitoxin MazE
VLENDRAVLLEVVLPLQRILDRNRVTPLGYTDILSYIVEMLMQVAKWGNSLAIRLPRAVVKALKLKEGDSIEVHVAGRRTFEVERAPTPQDLLRRLRKFRGRLPGGFRFDRLEANERD